VFITAFFIFYDQQAQQKNLSSIASSVVPRCLPMTIKKQNTQVNDIPKKSLGNEA